MMHFLYNLPDVLSESIVTDPILLYSVFHKVCQISLQAPKITSKDAPNLQYAYWLGNSLLTVSLLNIRDNDFTIGTIFFLLLKMYVHLAWGLFAKCNKHLNAFDPARC